MGRKKKKVDKPWCWYCNREFDDEKILIQHQKAKHFKCHICHKKLFSGPGLSIHCMQVHKETIDKIPAAVHGRDNIHVEIYGMQGIPAGAYRGAADEEPDEKRSRIDIAPPPMPTPMPFPQHFPSFGMPPMPSGPPPPSMGYGMPPGMPPGMMPPPPHGMPGAYPPPHNPYPGAPPPGVYIPPPGMPGAYPPPRSAMGMPPMGPGGAGPPMGGPPMPPPQQRSRFDQPNEDRWGGPPGRGGPPRTPPYDNGHDSQDYGRQDDYQHHGDYDDRFRERDAGPPGSSRFDQQVKTENDIQSSLAATSNASAAAAAVASKLGSRTRIVHPDDHSLSLEERRVKMLFEKRANPYH